MMHATRIIPSLAIVFLSGGQAVGQPAARNEASCVILAFRAGPAVEIRGEIQVPVDATGIWSLVVRKHDTAGRSAISQRGVFEADRGGLGQAGATTVSLQEDGEIVAKLSLSLGDNKVECSRTIRGNELDEL